MRIASLFIVVFVTVASAACFQGHASAEEWKPLFDGKTLKGWHPVGDGKWTVEDGVIVPFQFGTAPKLRKYLPAWAMSSGSPGT